MADSTRGILTDADREYLRKTPSERPSEYSRSAIHQRRKAIRQRTYQGLTDLELLFDRLPARERQKVFKSFEDGFVLRKRSALLRRGLAFLLLGVAEQENTDLDDASYYEHVFYHAIETTLNKVGFGAEEINVDVEISGWDHPDDGLAAADPEELTEEQLRHLLFDGQISSEEFCQGIENGPADSTD